MCATGGGQAVKCDLRFIATALPGIEARAGGASIGRDLYAQLSVLPLRVPPLREYAEDVPELLRQCTDQLTPASSCNSAAAASAAQTACAITPGPTICASCAICAPAAAARRSEEISLEEVEGELAAQAPIDAPLVKQDLLSLADARGARALRARLPAAAAAAVRRQGRLLAKRVGMERTHLYRKLRSLGIEISHGAED